MTVRDVTFDSSYFSDPHSFYAQLRAAGPIHRFTAPAGTSGVTGWLITADELARTVLSHPHIGKSPDTMFGTSSGTRRDGIARRLQRGAADYLVTHMLGADPPEHARLRGTVSAAFTPRALAELTPHIDALAARLVDDLDPTSTVDLVASLAFPLPVQVICGIVGIPQRHQHRIGRGSRILSDVLVATPDQLRSAATDFVRLILPRLYQRRLHPRADLLGAVAEQTRRGDITIKEALSTIALLLIAGHETTSNLIINTVLALADRPDELRRSRTDPDRLDRIVEETLRTEPPVPVTTLREARAPITLAGQSIDPGELLMVSILAANRDPAAITDPDTFNPDRPLRHLAFGHGVHYCLGAGLARLETRAALTHLLNRYPDITLAAPASNLRWRHSILFRRLETLPVQLRPGTAP